MIPINEPERREAITKFWGLYGAMGFALLCILLGGMVLKNGTLSADEKKDFDAFKKNDKIAAEMAERLEKLSPKIVDLFNDQHILHDSLHPSAKGKDLTKQGYLDALNDITIGAAKLSDSLHGYLKFYENNVSATDGRDLDIVFLKTLETLVSQADKAYEDLNESGGTLGMGGKSIIGIAAIIPETTGGVEVETESPKEQALREENEQLKKDKEALEKDDKNKAIKAANDERDLAIKELDVQKRLKTAFQNAYEASGMLEVAENFIQKTSPHANRNWYENNLEEPFKEVLRKYQSTIGMKLEAAKGAIQDISNNEATALKATISNLEGRNRSLL